MDDGSSEDAEEVCPVKTRTRRRRENKFDRTGDTGCLKGKSEAKEKERARCHQCMNNQCMNKERRIVVSCTYCKQKMYCTQCIKKWYPQMAEVDIANLCPFCRGNCNCSCCLRTGGIIKICVKIMRRPSMNPSPELPNLIGVLPDG